MLCEKIVINLFPLSVHPDSGYDHGRHDGVLPPQGHAGQCGAAADGRPAARPATPATPARRAPWATTGTCGTGAGAQPVAVSAAPAATARTAASSSPPVRSSASAGTAGPDQTVSTEVGQSPDFLLPCFCMDIL